MDARESRCEVTRRLTEKEGPNRALAEKDIAKEGPRANFDRQQHK
jgi:hypothetical protein